MDPFVESTETEEIRSLRSMRKAAWVIFAFQLLFLLIYMLRRWDDMILHDGFTIAMAVYALIFTGLMLDVLIKPIEQLNYHATEKKLILTCVLFGVPALCVTYYWLFINR